MKLRNIPLVIMLAVTIILASPQARDKKAEIVIPQIHQARISQIASSTVIVESASAAPEKKETTYQKMLRWDEEYDSLSRTDKAKFIRYWTEYYAKSLEVSSKKIHGSKAVGISISETNLGQTGVGRSKNNLFGCKIDDNGKYVGSYPRYENHRASVKGLVQFYKNYSEWRLWKNKYSSLGL